MIVRKIFETEVEWLNFRKGLFTSSRINELMAKPKDGDLSVGAISYIIDNIVDLETENQRESFNSFEMQWGKENEAQAVLRFAKDHNKDINSKDFIYTSIGGFVFYVNDYKSGGTPDIILLDDNKNVEIKAPNSDTHLWYKYNLTLTNFKKECPKYYDQMQHNMFLTGATSTIFMSFDPRFKKEYLQAFYLDIPRDEERITEILNKIEIAHNYKLKLLNNE